MSRPFFRSSRPPAQQFRVNGRIRAREVRVVGVDGHQVGVMSLSEALRLAHAQAVDLVEVAAQAVPPVCRLVDFGKFRYEQSKKDKEARKHQHANRIKEVQLSATIDDHDFSVKASRAIEFLCDDMKVKASLRFRGREMAHKEFGFQKVEQFLQTLAPYGQPDAPPRLNGRHLNVIVSPLPRNRRAPSPSQTEPQDLHPPADGPKPGSAAAPGAPALGTQPAPASVPDGADFGNTPFANLRLEGQ